MVNTFSRRAALTALAAGAATTALPSRPAATTAARGAIRPEFQAAFDAIGRARDHARWYEANVAQPAAERLRSMQAAFPHFTIETPAGTDGLRYLKWSTADHADVSEAKNLVRFAKVARKHPDAFPLDAAAVQRHKDARTFYAAHLRRERALARAARASGWAKAFKQDDKNALAWADAEEVLYRLPATNVAELALKVELMHAAGAFDYDYVPDAILADVRRIAGGEA